MDDCGIDSLVPFEFPETTEEISLFCNDIHNPNDIVNLLVPLPNLRALWLNGNPVVDACSNFDTISQLMPKLEICNSKLTDKAGEWAMLFYVRDQGVTHLEDIKSIDLTGKGVLHLQSTQVFEQMKNLEKLNISLHPEFFYTPEKVEALQFAALQGVDKEQKKNVEFTGYKISIQDLLKAIPNVKHLSCDIDLESYVLAERENLGILPNLQTVNDVSVEITEVTKRAKIKQINQLLPTLSQYAGVYQIHGQNVWYVNDEVGSAISHCDQPNIASRVFLYSPANKLDDSQACAFTVIWPIKEIKPQEALLKDFLLGFSEQQFRSARLHTWFKTPIKYFEQQLEKLRSLESSIDVETAHQNLQDNKPLKSSLSGVVKVYTEDAFKSDLESLDKTKFELVSEI